jgi:Sulfotransferase domain
MTLKVIGAGFGRTGTLSLKSALDELGLGPCYHMVEVNARPEHDAMWLALARGEASDWRPMLKGYASTVDWPTTYFWKELAAANPDAKIILTVRDPEAWYRSAAATIFARMLEFETLRAETLRANPNAVDPVRRRHMEMVNTIVVEKTFGGLLDKAHAIAVFNAHNADVRRSVPREKLLIYESGEGWEPLCAFLGVPVPATPYPKVNTTDDFVARFPVKR